MNVFSDGSQVQSSIMKMFHDHLDLFILSVSLIQFGLSTGKVSQSALN